MQAEPLPKLHLVPLDRCVLHESIDPQRVARLAAHLVAEQVLRNPPVVAAYADDDRLMVLDGATRTTALRQLGLQAVPVQVINYADARIELRTWAHLLHNVKLPSLLRALRDIPGLRVQRDEQPQTDVVAEGELAGQTLCRLLTSDGVSWTLSGAGGLHEEAQLLEEVFRCYVQRAAVQRLPHDTPIQPAALPADTVAVLFPRYSKHDLLTLTQAGGILPAGITRHIIPGRVLRLNVALAGLRTGTLAAQQAWFAAWVAERIAAGHARLYNEPTWLFDE